MEETLKSYRLKYGTFLEGVFGPGTGIAEAKDLAEAIRRGEKIHTDRVSDEGILSLAEYRKSVLEKVVTE